MAGLAAAAQGREAGQRDRVLLLALLALVCLFCWASSVQMALQMAAGAAAGGEHAHHHHHGGATAGGWPPYLMWAVMMAGMMVPAETPFLLRLLRLRQEAGAARPVLASAAFLVGYLAVWTLFSFGAAALQIALQAHALLDAQVASADPRLSALLLGLAGAAQLSPLKRRCLERCHTPDPALGAASPLAALSAGAAQGWLSLLSCGALMLVPLVPGAMDLVPMAALTLFLVVETLAPKRLRLSEVAGALLLCWAAFALSRMS